jgi:hypothetical protein
MTILAAVIVCLPIWLCAMELAEINKNLRR